MRFWMPGKGVLKRMGLTLDEYRALWDACKGRCTLCEKPMGRSRLPCVDHDHKTGLIRGLICMSCNDLLGFLHDDAGLFGRAAAYLLDPPAVDVIGARYVPDSPGAAT